METPCVDTGICLLSFFNFDRQKKTFTLGQCSFCWRGQVCHVTIAYWLDHRLVRVPKSFPEPFVDHIAYCFLLLLCSKWMKDGTRTFAPFYTFLSRFFRPSLSLIVFTLFLITREEYEKIKTYDDAEGSRQLLVTILPRKGPDSFDRFLSVLEEPKDRNTLPN